MVALLAFGGTYAYFTASATADSKTITTGYLKLTANGALTSINVSNVMPTQEILGEDAIKLTVDTSETGNYVAIKFVVTAEDANGDAISNLESVGINAATALGTSWAKVESKDGVYIYGTEAAPTKATGEIIVNSAAIVFDATDNWTQGSEMSDAKLMGAKITISMQAYSIQSTGTTSALVEALLAKF